MQTRSVFAAIGTLILASGILAFVISIGLFGTPVLLGLTNQIYLVTSRIFLDLQQFYLSAHSRDRLVGMRKGRRAIYLVVWLLKSLFLRLTPARRVLLALSFVLMWQRFFGATPRRRA